MFDGLFDFAENNDVGAQVVFEKYLKLTLNQWQSNSILLLRSFDPEKRNRLKRSFSPFVIRQSIGPKFENGAESLHCGMKFSKHYLH